jgi:hypothetical protein
MPKLGCAVSMPLFNCGAVTAFAPEWFTEFFVFNILRVGAKRASMKLIGLG